MSFYRTQRNRGESSIQPGRKNGLAAVEVAIVLPIILFMTFATLDVCDGIFLLQKAEIAAHEGARTAIEPQSDQDRVHDAVQVSLDSRGIEFDDITTIVTMSADPDLANVLDPITVSVEIDLARNRRLPVSIFQVINGDTIFAEVTMYKE